MRTVVRAKWYRKVPAIFSVAGVAAVCLLPLLHSGDIVSAAANQGAGVLRVSPALSDISLSRGETSTTVVTTITNLSASKLAVAVSVQDFGAQPNQPGAISLYSDGYNPKTNPHSLQTTMSVEPSDVVLEAHASQRVAVVLNGLGQLAPGGHYGAVLFSPESVAPEGGRSKVSLQSAVASLIFLKTAGGGVQRLQLLPLKLSSVGFTLPGTVYVDFKNTGNTQTAPQGQLTLFGPTGAITSTTVLNAGSGLILPGSSRLFTVQLPGTSPLHGLPGKYRLELRYHADGQAGLTTISRSFYYINLAVILPALVLLLILAWLLKAYHGSVWRVGKRFLCWARNGFRKKPKELPPPPKPKRRPPPLIQG